MRAQTKYGQAVGIDLSRLGLKKCLRHAPADEIKSFFVNLGSEMGATEAQLAEVFGVSDRWIRYLAKRPMPDLGDHWNQVVYGLPSEDDDESN